MVMGFRQNNDLFYLAGIDQEETVIVLADAAMKEDREILFVRETSEQLAIWKGARLTKSGYRAFRGEECAVDDEF